MATNWDEINAQITGRSTATTKPVGSSASLKWDDINAQISARAKATPIVSPGVDPALANQLKSRGATPQQIATLASAKTPSILSELGSAYKNATINVAQGAKDAFTPGYSPFAPSVKTQTLPPTPTNALGYGQGNNLNKENVLPPGPTNALASLPKEDSVKFSLTEQPKFSQNVVGLQKIRNQVANEQQDSAYREQARQERVNQILIPALYAGGVGAAAEIGTAGSLAAAGKAALTTGTNIAIFSALQAVEDKLNFHLANYLPQEGTNQQQDNAKVVADILQVIGNGLLTHGVMKRAPAVADAFTKKTVEYYNLPRNVTIPAETIADIFKTGKLATPEQLDLFAKVTGGNRAKIKAAIKNGLDVTIPAEGVTKLVDKPYWAKIKAALRLSPTDEIVSSKQYGSPTENLKGLPAPTMADQLASKVAELPPSERAQAPTMADQLKQAVEPHQALIEEAKKYPSAEEFVKAQGKVVLRGGTNFEPSKVGDGGMSVTTDPEIASSYAGSDILPGGDHGNIPPGEGSVHELVIDKNAKIFNAMDAPKELKDFLLKKSYSQGREKITAFAKQNGYDGVDFSSLAGQGEIRIVNPDIIKTKSQLTDIWNKAHPAPTMAEQLKQIAEPKPIASSEMKPAKSALDVSKSLVEKGMEGLPEKDLAQYSTISKADQIEKVGSLLSSDIEGAKQMALGNVLLPPGVQSQVLFNAVKEYAKVNKDVQLQMDLAKSPLNTERSLAAQTLGSSGFNNGASDTDPVKIIAEVNKKLSESTKSTVTAEKSKFYKAIKKARAPKQSWNDFISEITCP